MRILRLFIIFSFLVLSPPIYAQLSLGTNPQPAAPQTAEMTRYGYHGVNLYTGRVSVSIPIGEYRDKDFSIPVSLEYNYNGMRPNEQAAEPGLGWILSCGGIVTREVVGNPDEETGSFCIIPGPISSSVDVLPFDDYPFAPGEPEIEYVALGVGENADRSVTALFQAVDAGGSPHYYDASSDIYHFRMPGHSGSFFRRTDGSFVVYDAGGRAGTYRIKKENVWTSDGQGASFQNSRITITTGDGYRFIFGSLEQSDTYTERASPGKEAASKKGAIIAWRLQRIVSPGGAEAFFYYGLHGDDREVRSFNADRWLSIGGSDSSYELSGTSRLAMYSPLSDIECPGGWIHFYYGEKDEDHSGTFVNRFGTRSLNPSQATQTLDSVEVNGVLTRLSYTYNSLGNPYPFLTEVHTDGMGSWRMDYEGLTDGYFPPFWTAATDHWGYLNSTTKSLCDNQTVTWSMVSTLSGYQETLGSAKTPNMSAVRLGLLTTLSYPTGGSTAFSYEANSYGRAVIKSPSANYVATDMVESGYGPGMRISRIENRDADGTVTDARNFTYGTGRLLAWPRYRVGYGGSVLGVGVSVYYATTGGLHRPGSVLLEYPLVTETRLDGSGTEHRFADWTMVPDVLSNYRVQMLRGVEGGGGLYSFGYMQNISNPNHLGNLLEPLSSFQHYRGMPVSVAEYASGGTNPLQTTRTVYDISGVDESTTPEYINVGDACARVLHYAGEPRPLSSTTSTRYGQDSVLAVTHYSYNALGQVTSERTKTSDGDSLIVIRTYPQDYPQDALLAEMAAANFVDYPVTEVHLRRRGAATFDTTAAVRYDYTRYITAAGDSSYAASAVHRRRGNGDWVTEGSFVYDNAGNVIQITDADGIVTSYVWNSVYGVSIVVKNASRSQVTACLAQSPAVDITNTAAAAARLRSGLPQARVSDFEYRRVGLPTRMTDPAGHTLRYFYDDNDRLVTVREDDAGILQQFQYNTVTR